MMVVVVVLRVRVAKVNHPDGQASGLLLHQGQTSSVSSPLRHIDAGG